MTADVAGLTARCARSADVAGVTARCQLVNAGARSFGPDAGRTLDGECVERKIAENATRMSWRFRIRLE